MAVPPNPHWLTFSADGRKVYAACHDSNLVAVLDPLTVTVTATIPVGASPHSTALSPDGAQLAVVNYTSSEVSIIDTDRDVELKRPARPARTRRTSHGRPTGGWSTPPTSTAR